MDESPKQLIRETRSSIAMKPGHDRKEDLNMSDVGGKYISCFRASKWETLC